MIYLPCKAHDYFVVQIYGQMINKTSCTLDAIKWWSPTKTQTLLEVVASTKNSKQAINTKLIFWNQQFALFRLRFFCQSCLTSYWCSIYLHINNDLPLHRNPDSQALYSYLLSFKTNPEIWLVCKVVSPDKVPVIVFQISLPQRAQSDQKYDNDKKITPKLIFKMKPSCSLMNSWRWWKN